MNSEFLEQIKERREKLEEVKTALKEKFIGIDSVIDKIIDNISLWYLTPEIQFKPLIISLWGITGVGKTDLVRTLVRLLRFTDKFIEIQMDNRSEYNRTIESYLEGSGVDMSQPAILLLDEIQRYRTLNEQGEMVENKYFNDIWMLLSDGKLQSNSQRRAEVMELMFEEMYWQDRNDEDDEDAPNDGKEKSDDEPKVSKKKKDYRFRTSLWTASRFKKLLGLKMPIDVIMELKPEERVKMLEEYLKTDNINEGKSYEKLLIFISGNLDEAFKMADDVEDSERDADIYHELSKRVTIIHVKNALALKFKPEQIARFGNIHIIYPCLDKASYYTIIKKNCYQILQRIEKEHHIKISLSDVIFDVIYRNGVFPAQGVRPAISTVFNVLGSNLPYFMYHALLNDVDDIHLEFENKTLFTTIAGSKITKEITLDIDLIRDNKSVDERRLYIIHEIGHALVYSVLFNTPPRQIIINGSGFANGFVINHNSIDNKTFLKNQLAIYMAGIVAEELVFGEDFKSNGAAFDILTATDVAGKFVRAFGMDGIVSRVIKQHTQSSLELNFDVDKTNDLIENLIADGKKNAKDIINKNLGTYKAIVKFCVDNGSINVEQFLFICNNRGMNLIQKEINDKLIYGYDEKVKHFLKQ
jgi:cell division protease FtsH